MGIKKMGSQSSQAALKRSRSELNFSPGGKTGTEKLGNVVRMIPAKTIVTSTKAGEGAPSSGEALRQDVGTAASGKASRGLVVNTEKQGKHICDSSSFITRRSIFHGTVEDAQELVSKFAGTGQYVNPEKTKERVDFGRIIGLFINKKDDVGVVTTMGIIHYSKTGAHIVPCQPREFGGLQ